MELKLISSRKNVDTDKAPFFSNNRMMQGDGIPETGDYQVGDIIVSSTQENDIFGWVCTEAGNPGVWNVIGGGGGTKVMPFYNIVSFSDARTSIEIGIEGFDRNSDLLEVHYDGLLLVENVHYRIGADGTSIETVSDAWNKNADDYHEMSFRVLKTNFEPQLPNSMIARFKSNVTVEEEVSEVLIGIAGFTQMKDILTVYKNSVYLIEGVDYDISGDGSRIMCKDGTWKADNGPNRFVFEVLRNVQIAPEGAVGSVSMASLEDDVILAINTSGASETLNEYISDANDFENLKGRRLVNTDTLNLPAEGRNYGILETVLDKDNDGYQTFIPEYGNYAGTMAMRSIADGGGTIGRWYWSLDNASWGSDLSTNDKTIIGAINELHDSISNASGGSMPSELTVSSTEFKYAGGTYSSGGSRVSLGDQNVVTGATSIAMGQENQVTGGNSLSLGRKNICTKHNTFLIGLDNKIINSYDYACSFVFGESNKLGFNEGDYFGGYNTVADQAYGSIAIGQYNTAGYKGVAIGESNYGKYEGIAIGYSNHAYDSAVALGDGCKAISNHATAVGVGAYANGNGEYYPSAFGYYSKAEAGYTLAMGASAYARKSRAIGVGGDAKEQESVAIGYNANAYSRRSAALTPNTYCTGENAIAMGYSSETTAKNAIAIGHCIKVDGEGVTAFGHFNNPSSVGSSSGPTGTALVVGNGIDDTARSNAFEVSYAGEVIGRAAYQTMGADYAEYFEWLDGNVNNEDRRGYFVTLDGDKIKKAKEGDYILGIVSAYPAVVGNNDMEWSGKFLLDEFGDPIKKVQKAIIKDYELCTDVYFTKEEMETLTDEERKQREIREVEKEVECEYFVLNPDFDPDREYVHRADRPEWDTIGMLGVLTVYDDGTCQVNGFCKCNDDGIATACERGFDTYRVMERVNENLVKVVFK